MIVGWRVASNMRTTMVLDAIEMARWSRGNTLLGLTCHSDAGSQFTSVRYGERLAEIGAVPSIGSVGDSFDNALAETVNGYYKCELIYGPARTGPWKTAEDVELATLSWVHWHNTARLHGYFNDLSPTEFEAIFYATKRTDQPLVEIQSSVATATVCGGFASQVFQALAQRCRIVLGCAAGKPNKEVAADVGVWPQTVGVWRRRFVERRLEGLTDEPRPGGPRTVTDEQVESVVVATLERAPKDATHWSRASMAAETGLSKSTVGRIWKAFGLKPHRIDTFKLSNDPQFIDKVRDVVGLYLDPPEKAIVLCVDEKSQIQALDRSAPVLPMMPGMPSAAPTTTCVTGSPPCSRRWMWPPARSSDRSIADTARPSSRSS